MLCNITDRVIPALEREGDSEHESDLAYDEAVDDLIDILKYNKGALEKMVNDYDAFAMPEFNIIYDLISLLNKPYENDNTKAAEIYHVAKQKADAFVEYLAHMHVSKKMGCEAPELKDIYKGE